MTAPQRPAGSRSWERAQQVGPEFRPTLGWVPERGGGRWWRWPLGFLVFLAVAVVGLFITSLLVAIARQFGTQDLPLLAVLAAGIAASVGVGAWVGYRVARPPIIYVARPHLMAVKSDQQRRLEAGAEGEFITGELLRPLEAEGYLIRHAIDVPGEERPIDHVIIGPSGLFVVESKYYVEDVHLVGDRLFGDGTPLDMQAALLRHQCDEMWRRVSAEAGISVRGIFSMVGNQVTPAFMVDTSLWCSPGRELGAVIRAWHPRDLSPELVGWLMAKVERAFGLTGAVDPLPPPPLDRRFEGTSCDRAGCQGHREIVHGDTGPLLLCSARDADGCPKRWTIDGWPLRDSPPAPA